MTCKSLSHKRSKICIFGNGGGVCEHLGPHMLCRLSGRYGHGWIGDPDAACPLAKWMPEADPTFIPVRDRGTSRSPDSGCNCHQRSFSEKLMRGATGLTKAVLGLDKAPDEAIDLRWAVCNRCSEMGRLGFCKQCGCYLRAKVRVASEACPLGKWKPETAASMEQKTTLEAGSSEVGPK